MLMRSDSVRQVKVLDEIIDNAIGLPVESQDLLLMMAKAMRHTRDCVMRQSAVEEFNRSYSNYHKHT